MDIIHCYECDAEFDVISLHETEDVVAFCPYCGSDVVIEFDEDGDEIGEDDNEGFRN